MSVCDTFIDSAIGRISAIANVAAYPTGADLYEGKFVWVLDINALQVYTGTEWRTVLDVDGWTTWTPTLSGTGYAIGNGAISGLYKLMPDKSYQWAIALLWGSTSTSGAGPMTVNTPATFINTAMGTTGVGITQLLANAHSGGMMTDASTSVDYPLFLKYLSATTCTVQAIAYNGASAGVAYATRVNCTSTIPVAPATSDIFFLHGYGFA